VVVLLAKVEIGTDLPEEFKALMSGAFLFATNDGMKRRDGDDRWIS
jgi:hypothetical protein